MILIQLTGLSGAGKSTLASSVRERLLALGYCAEVIDGDEYRQNLYPELGFSPEDRRESSRRSAYISQILLRNKVIVILATINPYESARKQVEKTWHEVRTVWVNCDLNTLTQRDPKGLYRKALLPEEHPDKIHNLTGVNAPYEPPQAPDLTLHTHLEDREASEEKLFSFVLAELRRLEAEQAQHLPRHASAWPGCA